MGRRDRIFPARGACGARRVCPRRGVPGPSTQRRLFVYVLEGSVVTLVKGPDAQTVQAGGVFYESPTDVHTVSRNASETHPAKLLVFYLKQKGAPPTELIGEK